MPWFAEGPLLVYLIRFGPDAHSFGDPYTHSFPLSLDGEFKGVSTKPLTAYAVRTAQEAGRTLLGKEPFWRHQHRRKHMAGFADIDAAVAAAKAAVADGLSAVDASLDAAEANITNAREVVQAVLDTIAGGDAGENPIVGQLAAKINDELTPAIVAALGEVKTRSDALITEGSNLIAKLAAAVPHNEGPPAPVA